MICFIDCYINSPTIDSINEFVELNPTPWTYHVPSQYGLSSLLNLKKQPSAIILLGSSANVYENRPWQKPLEEYLRKQLNKKIPMLGICYGHQLMAHSFGCKVDFINTNQEIIREVRSINFHSNCLNISSMSLPYTHGQIVTTITDEFNVLGQSRHFEFECIQHKYLPYIGIQAHPEASREFIVKDCLYTDSVDSIQRNGHNFLVSFIKYAQSI